MSRETHIRNSAKVKNFGLKEVECNGKSYWYASLTYHEQFHGTRIFECRESTRDEAIDEVWKVFKRKRIVREKREAEECIETERAFAEVEKAFDSLKEVK